MLDPLDEKIRYHLGKIDYRLGMPTHSTDDIIPYGFTNNWDLIPMFQMTVERCVAESGNDEALITYIRNNEMKGIMLGLLYKHLQGVIVDNQNDADLEKEVLETN